MEAISRTDAVVEVNTGGLNRGSTTEVYPASWMLGELKKRGVRMMVNADAHRGEHLGGHYEEARRELAQAGFDSTVLFRGRGPDGRAIWAEDPL
jgi:histidinol-phosphatase (PHP family)